MSSESITIRRAVTKDISGHACPPRRGACIQPVHGRVGLQPDKAASWRSAHQDIVCKSSAIQSSLVKLYDTIELTQQGIIIVTYCLITRRQSVTIMICSLRYEGTMAPCSMLPLAMLYTLSRRRCGEEIPQARRTRRRDGNFA